MKHYLFIDDSGSKDWDVPYTREFVDYSPSRNNTNRKFWMQNYFVLCGLYISESNIRILNPQIDEMKKKFFGTKHVEIKSDWLRNPHKQRKHYLEPYKLTVDSLKDFIDNHWYKIFEENPKAIQLQAFVLDKRFFNRQRDRITPLQKTIQVLFDRVELHPHKQCEIIFDQMDSDIKSTSNTQGTILRISNKEVNLGSFHSKYSHSNPIFEKSKNSNFLQLADTAAYNVLRQFVEYGDQWEKTDGKLDLYEYFKRISSNFYLGKMSILSGYGIVKIPNSSRAKWVKSGDKD
jgi:hypothetical protein